MNTGSKKDQRLARRIRLIAIASIVASLGVTAVNSGGNYTVAAAQSAVKTTTVQVNGKQQSWNAQPFLQGGTTFVPLREAAKAIGGAVEWNAASKSAVIRMNGDVVTHRSGTSVMSINGYTLNMSAPSLTVKGTLMVPLRSLTDSLKATLRVTQTSTNMSIAISTDSITYLSKELTSVDQYLKEKSYSGMALVAKDGVVLLRKGYGLAGKDTLNRPDMKSRIASITKSFTAASIMKLAEEGKVKLGDPISTYVSGIPRGDDITLHMLLSHTSGLPSEFKRSTEMTIEQTIKEIRTKKVEFEPGTAYKYSNNGYVLLAYVIEQMSGSSFADYVEKTMLTAAGMKSSGTASPSTPTIQGYLLKNGKWTEAPYYASQSGTGTLYSTVDDLLKWERLLSGNKLLTNESLEAMYSPSYSDKHYGYGWIVKPSDTGTTVFHNGSGSGYSTGISRDLGNGTVVILLGNHAGLDTVTMMDAIQMVAVRDVKN